MGIPMDPNNDIHTPTVPAGPTSGPGAAGRDLSKLSLDELIAEKERLESELKVLGEVLQSHGVTMSTPLTTFDGYPRDDLDIAQIRTTRARIIPLRNDYKTLMNAIETAVHARFASLQDAQRISSSTEPSTAIPAGILNGSATEEGEELNAGGRPGIVETPFAKVGSVAAGSPAAGAGLKAGDKVRVFGGVNWMNHENLAGVARVVAGSEGRPLQVKVSRPNENGQGATELTLQLTPRRDWGGRGLLGCHLVPL